MLDMGPEKAPNRPQNVLPEWSLEMCFKKQPARVGPVSGWMAWWVVGGIKNHLGPYQPPKLILNPPLPPLWCNLF